MKLVENKLGAARYQSVTHYGTVSISHTVAFFNDGEATLTTETCSGATMDNDEVEIEISWAEAEMLVGVSVGIDSIQ